MTLILSALTHEYVVQVSDRRVTNLRTGQPMPDTINKAVLFCGHISFGYTGLAEVDGLSADRWLAQHLLEGGPSAQASLEHVRDEATRAWRKTPGWRHAFVGVGWSRGKPILHVISNHDLSKFDEQSRTPVHPNFQLVTLAPPPGSDANFMPAGQTVPRVLRAKLQRNLSEAARRGGPVALARLLSEAAQAVPAANQTVGPDLMVAVVPRVAVPVTAIQMPMAGSISDDRASFVYIREANDRSPRFYTPMWACGIAVGGGEVRYGEPNAK
jgi:hypothetical protein